jgi:imidazolonepropionase-like amidohydrolase
MFTLSNKMSVFMLQKTHLALLFLTVQSLLFAQLKPNNGVPESKAAFYAFKNARIVVSPDKVISNGTLVIQNDKIIKVGSLVSIPKGAVEIDCEGKTILPAFIETHSSFGMPNIERRGSFFPQLESSKMGAYYWNESIHPEVNAQTLFKNDDAHADLLMKMGFGLVSTHVNDGISQGTSALVVPKVEMNKALMNQQAAYFSFQKGVSAQTYPSSQMGSIALLRQAFYDAKWYAAAKEKDKNISLEALNTQMNQALLFQVQDKWELFRAKKIMDEFNLSAHYIGSGNEYEAIQQLKNFKSTLIIPLTFPTAYDVKDPYLARQIPLRDLKHWELAPSNAAILRENNVPIAFTSTGLKSPEEFWKALQLCIKRGLSANDALKALTTIPAQILGVSSDFGTLEEGKKASFLIFDENPFEQEAVLLESWLLGNQFVVKKSNANDIRGKYNMLIDKKTIALEIEGTKNNPTAKVRLEREFMDTVSKIMKKDTLFYPAFLTLTDSDITLQFNGKSKEWDGSINLHAKVNTRIGIFEGDGTLPNGKWIKWTAIKNTAAEKDKDADKFKKDSTFIGSVWFPNMAYGFEKTPEKQNVVIENATVWTNEKEGILKDASIVVENGKIKYVGTGTFQIPANAVRIDAKGKHVTSGIIDEHSHIAISKGVNESGQTVTAEVSIADVVTADDINIYRQLSGGVTASQLLHGSANAIGGQSALIKLKWGHSPAEMLIPNAPKFIKCALGENVKQANWGDFNTVRFPQTRMGVEQVFYDAFDRAKKYEEEHKAWKSASEKDKAKSSAPRVDLELEVLNEILRKERFITCHSYVQSEINMLLHVADSMGFTLNTFTHILEGYKVADKMKAHGAGGSTFADWWAYKFEVNDAIPYNAAMMNALGIVTAINSDDAEMGRRLNQEAGKIVKYGGASEEDAWKMVTLNPAKLLHLDDRMGSIKNGKDADLVIWSENPLSIEAIVEKTIIDGEILFDLDKESENRLRIEQEKARLISKMLKSDEPGEKKRPFKKKKKRHFHCDTHGEEGSEEENTH